MTVSPEAVVARLRETEGPTALLGIAIEAVGIGTARASMRIDARMLNGLGVAHGGMIFTLADTVFAYACNSGNVASVGQAASMCFLSPARLGERLVAEAREAALAGRTGVYDIRVCGEDGRVVAVFQGQSRSLGRPVIGQETGPETPSGAVGLPES